MHITFWFNAYSVMKLFSFSSPFVGRFSALGEVFFFVCLCWVFVVVCGLSLVETSGGYSSLQCMGFLLQWLLSLQSTGSRCMVFSSCSTWTQLLWHVDSRARRLQ